MSFHIAIGEIYRTIAELNVRIGYLLILIFHSAMNYCSEWNRNEKSQKF